MPLLMAMLSHSKLGLLDKCLLHEYTGVAHVELAVVLSEGVSLEAKKSGIGR
jgi:hypothetical protein